MIKPMHLNLRWWHWLLLILGFILTIVFVILLSLRSMGRSDYQRVIADIRAQGKIATLDEFIASAPAVDIALQDEWDLWSKHAPEFPVSISAGKSIDYKAWEKYILGQGSVPSDVLADLNSTRAQFEPALRMLRTGKLVTTAFGWIAQDLPPEKRAQQPGLEIRIPSLLTCRSLTNWLHHEACTAADPSIALADLRHLHRAMQRSACLIDSMIAIAIGSIRDQAYLHLQLLGRLPEAERIRWCEESSDYLHDVAAGFDGERAWFIDGECRWMDAMNLLESFALEKPPTLVFSQSPPTEFDFSRLYYGPITWSTTRHDAAITAPVEARIARRLRGETTESISTIQSSAVGYWGFGGMGLLNLIECGITAIEPDANHRITRLAVRILAQSRIHGLPTDEADLCQKFNDPLLLTPSGDHLHLRYERLADDRFRLVVSPTSPVSNIDDPKRMAERSKTFGQPPSKDSTAMQTRTALEIPLPAHLLPPKP
jgi:hypothetical protein